MRVWPVYLSGRDLVVPLYLALPLATALPLLYWLAVRAAVREGREDRVCRALTDSPPGGDARTPHPACSPRHACPDCVPPAEPTEPTQSRGELLAPVADELYLFPRVSRPPRAVRQQSLSRPALLAPRDMCARTCPYLLVLVLTGARDWAGRLDCRRTWAGAARTDVWPGHGPLRARVHVLFVLACRTVTGGEWRALQAESDQFQDVLLLDSALTALTTLTTLTTLAGLQWARRACPDAQFYVKSDPDTFLNLPALLDLLLRHETRLGRSVTGHMSSPGRAAQRSDGDLHVDQVPVSAAGLPYILSREAVRRLLALFPFYPAVGAEDVFITGVLARGAGLQHFGPAHNVCWAESYPRVGAWCRLPLAELVAVTSVNSTERRASLWASTISPDMRCGTGHSGGTSASCWTEFPQL